MFYTDSLNTNPILERCLKSVDYNQNGKKLMVWGNAVFLLLSVYKHLLIWFPDADCF